MWPASANSSRSTRGSTAHSNRATPRAEAVERAPVMYSTGTSRAANAASGVGSVKSACFQRRTLTTDGGDRRLALLRRLAPAARPHPVVDEVLGGGVAVARVERGGGGGDGIADAVGVVRRRPFAIDDRKQRRLVEGEAAHALGSVEGSDQRDGGAVRMADEDERRSGPGEHRLDQGHLVAQA